MPDLLVNLKGDGKRMRFLRLRLALEVGSERTAASVKALTPRVLDSFQIVPALAHGRGRAGLGRDAAAEGGDASRG